MYINSVIKQFILPFFFWHTRHFVTSCRKNGQADAPVLVSIHDAQVPLRFDFEDFVDWVDECRLGTPEGPKNHEGLTHAQTGIPVGSPVYYLCESQVAAKRGGRCIRQRFSCS